MRKRESRPKYHLVFHAGGWWPEANDPYAYDEFSCQYYEAALSVGRRAIRTSERFLAVPMLHLLRHALELKFKSLLFCLEDIDGAPVPTNTTASHDLDMLEKYLTSYDYHLPEYVRDLSRFLNDLDPNAQHTRYPDSRDQGKMGPSRLLMVRSEMTRVLLNLGPGDGFRKEISVNLILRHASSSDMRAFFGGSLDALRESGHRGEPPD